MARPDPAACQHCFIYCCSLSSVKCNDSISEIRIKENCSIAKVSLKTIRFPASLECVFSNVNITSEWLSPAGNYLGWMYLKHLVSAAGASVNDAVSSKLNKAEFIAKTQQIWEIHPHTLMQTCRFFLCETDFADKPPPIKIANYEKKKNKPYLKKILKSLCDALMFLFTSQRRWTLCVCHSHSANLDHLLQTPWRHQMLPSQ